jgi:hypothetical protein
MKKRLYLKAFFLMGPMTVAQLSRFMTGIGVDSSDKAILLAELLDEKKLKQSVSLQGIVYSLTEQGLLMLQDTGLPEYVTEGPVQDSFPEEAMMAEKAKEFRSLFDREEDYPAHYTEQANAIVPVFLSIRDGDKIILKISIIVETTEEAKKICAAWMLNSDKTYKTIWNSIAGEAPVPEYYINFLEKRKDDVTP